MERIKPFAFIALLALAIGCAQHTRTADLSLDGETMYSQLSGFLGTATSSSVQISQPGDSNLSSQFGQWAQDPNASVYFSQQGSLGPVQSVASLSDFSVFYPNSNGQTLTASSIADIQIFFVDDPASDGHHTGLLVAIEPTGQTGYTVTVFTSSSDPTTGKGQYSTTLNDASGNTLVLQSSDTDSNGNLNSVIQLQVFANGSYIGQFSTLVGFTQ